MKSYSQTGNPTSRLFLLKSLFAGLNKKCILTDSADDLGAIRDFGETILDKKITEICSVGEFFLLPHSENDIFVADINIFRTEKNLYHFEHKENLKIERGNTRKIDEIIERLLENGFEYDPSLGDTFTYQKTGSILSVIGNNINIMYQIEWFDTEIDAILMQNRISQERKFLNEITFSKKNSQKFFHEKNDEEKYSINVEILESLPKILPEVDFYILGCDFLQEISVLQKFAILHFSEINTLENEKIGVDFPEIKNIHELIASISNNKNTPIFYTRNPKTLENFLENNSLKNITIIHSNSRKIESFEFKNDNKIFKNIPKLLIADDILGKIFVKSRKSGSVAKNLDLLISLSPGDFVVHRDHGIAKFHAIVKKQMGDLEREYLELHYADNDKLFVPITEIFRISKYLGENDVTLTRLGGKEWEKTLTKTDEELQKIAENILETNARRQMVQGRAFGRFEAEEQIFRDDFPYEYTDDQLRGIFEVFADMEAETPMDRLLSGDVGFGKTEIAMNASYKAFLSGAQVAVISPLVVLAMEHYESFVERLGKFGVKIALLSRMNSPKETQEILEKMKTGEINIVIGTHRLLSEDVKWKKLGLLIIDEEHKFGVMHKEKIKKIRTGIDILSLSATPIPRSLNLALSGLRKISLLTTPPKKKKPIETIITNWNENIIQTGIERELARGGQVIIVHNRIKGIESLKQELEEILSASQNKAKIIVTHGRMNGDEIEERIHDFKEKKYNILLTTTIIENGVNFLSANTIVIIDPEEFGLASLHQLRGRVGRRGDQGYCYLAYRKISLNPDEKNRLITIANNNHLGAGFEIAMRDMEIRGAGDILGIKQSGKSKDVGLPLYFRMLEEKIAELKHEKQTKIFTKIELDLSYIIPNEFFISELDKLNFFREVENIDNISELEALENEFLQDERNEHIENLFLLLKARIIFGAFGIEKISKNGNFYVLDFKKGHTIYELKNFLDAFDKGKNMIVVSTEKIRIDAKSFQNSRDFLQNILNEK
ncbi:MAG: DEAD/DEAH box helicase [Candidatus Altimarinota bacterium]